MRRFLIAPFAALLLIAVSAPAAAQEEEIPVDLDPRPILAVYDIQVEGVSLTEKKIAGLTEYLRTRLTIENHYRVVPGEATTRALLEVKAKSHDPQCDTSCKIALGNALAAAKVVETRVDRVGSKCSVSAQVFDVGREISDVAGETETPVECTETGIRGGLKQVAAMLKDPGVGGPGLDTGVPAPRTVVTDTGRVVDMSAIDTGEYIVNVDTGLTGIVVIDSNPPGASLIVNGRDEGVAKKSLQLNVGRYVIVARLDDYYNVARSEVTVEANKVKRVTMELTPAFGALDVSCTPAGAEVYVDGRFAGPCPYANPRMKRGTYAVEVREGFFETLARQVTIRDGATTTEQFDLPAAWGRLDIDSTPRGAEVWFDGRQIGTTPMMTEMTAAGKYKVRLVMPMYEPIQFEVDLGGGRTVRKNVPLVADFGSVSVDTSPRGATVTVDDDVQRCDATPCSFGQMATGLHVLTIEKDGYAREVKNVEVKRNGRQSLNVTLRQKLGTLTIFAKYRDGTDCEGDIYIDGQRQSDPTPFMGQVLATTHVVEVRCPGARPVAEDVTVEHNKTATRTLSACRPTCGSATCGPDGCGGDCGMCGYGTRCLNGQCRQIQQAPRPQPVETSRASSTESRPQTVSGGSSGASGSSSANRDSAQGRISSSSKGGGIRFTWETAGIGYMGSIFQGWNAINVTPLELGFRLGGLLVSTFFNWQLLIPWQGLSNGYANVIQLGVRSGYQFLDLADGNFAMFVDGKLGWEYNFDRSDVFTSGSEFDGVYGNEMVVGVRLGIRISYAKISVCADYSTGNGLGAGLMLSVGN